MRILGWLALLGVAGICLTVVLHQLGAHHWHDVFFWVAAWVLFVYAAFQVKQGRS